MRTISRRAITTTAGVAGLTTVLGLGTAGAFSFSDAAENTADTIAGSDYASTEDVARGVDAAESALQVLDGRGGVQVEGYGQARQIAGEVVEGAKTSVSGEGSADATIHVEVEPTPAEVTASTTTEGNYRANWDAIAECESGGNWQTNTGNGFHGGLQFHPQTWTGHGGGEFAPTADQATEAQQKEVAERVLDTQGIGAWPTCGAYA